MNLCHRDYHDNKRRILSFLVPVWLAIAEKYPLEKLLTEYDLGEYRELIQACVGGDLVRLESTIEANMNEFIRTGVFSVIERVR